MSLDYFLDQAVTIERPSITQDSSGGSRRTWVAVAGLVDVECNIQPIAAHVRESLAQRQIYLTHQLWFAEPVDIRRGDRAKDEDGNFYLIEAVRDIAKLGRVFVAEGKQQT